MGKRVRGLSFRVSYNSAEKSDFAKISGEPILYRSCTMAERALPAAMNYWTSSEDLRPGVKHLGRLPAFKAAEGHTTLLLIARLVSRLSTGRISTSAGSWRISSPEAKTVSSNSTAFAVNPS